MATGNFTFGDVVKSVTLIPNADGSLSLPVAGSGGTTVNDIFTTGQVLADQAGAGGVLTFTFASPVDLVWVRCDGGQGRADPFGGTPAATVGIRCDDGVPNPLTILATTVKVFANSGTTVQVWGFRY